MTLSELKHIESEVIDLVNKVLDSVRDKSFSDYVLLLSRAGYQVENEGTYLSPYVVSSQLEIYQDMTREYFLVGYLNSYAGLLNDNVFMTDETKEYNLNIQMMVYAQIWESHRLLKTLQRIASILNGGKYEWRIAFENKERNGKSKAVAKAKVIEDKILKPLQNTCSEFATFIANNYDSQLRNDFAHASYYIDLKRNSITSLDIEEYAIKKKTDFYDWEQMFVSSVMLSYHLPRLIKDRCNNFIIDYPNLQSVTIDWPSYKEPGKISQILIYPHEIGGGIEFSFHK